MLRVKASRKQTGLNLMNRLVDCLFVYLFTYWMSYLRGTRMFLKIKERFLVCGRARRRARLWPERPQIIFGCDLFQAVHFILPCTFEQSRTEPRRTFRRSGHVVEDVMNGFRPERDRHVSVSGQNRTFGGACETRTSHRGRCGPVRVFCTRWAEDAFCRSELMF